MTGTSGWESLYEQLQLQLREQTAMEQLPLIAAKPRLRFVAQLSCR